MTAGELIDAFYSVNFNNMTTEELNDFLFFLATQTVEISFIIKGRKHLERHLPSENQEK